MIRSILSGLLLAAVAISQITVNPVRSQFVYYLDSPLSVVQATYDPGVASPNTRYIPGSHDKMWCDKYLDMHWGQYPNALIPTDSYAIMVVGFINDPATHPVSNWVPPGWFLDDRYMDFYIITPIQHIRQTIWIRGGGQLGDTITLMHNIDVFNLPIGLVFAIQGIVFDSNGYLVTSAVETRITQ